MPLPGGLPAPVERFYAQVLADEVPTVLDEDALDQRGPRGGRIDGQLLPVRTALTWYDDGTPWAVLTTEEVVTDVDLVGDLSLDVRPPTDG